MNATISARVVEIPAGAALLHADLRIPPRPQGVVIFAHGSGSSRFSARNVRVAESLNLRGQATLLLDLLTTEEESVDVFDARYRFDIPRLAARVRAAAEWTQTVPELSQLPIGYFGASTGAAAALIAAAERPDLVRAVVSRGGRPDLANHALPRVHAPTLLIVGGADRDVIEMNREAMRQMLAKVELRLVHGATHLFEEPGTLEEVERLAGDWFERYLKEAGAPSCARPPQPPFVGLSLESRLREMLSMPGLTRGGSDHKGLSNNQDRHGAAIQRALGDAAEQQAAEPGGARRADNQ